MAVYTEVGFDAADALVQRLGLGALTRLAGIRGGIENTNYWADTSRGPYVLTLFERLPAAELPYYLGLMDHVAQRGVPAPRPVADAAGGFVHALAGKPAAVVTRLVGAVIDAPAVDHCRQVGALLARLHVAAADYAPAQPRPRGLDWCADAAADLRPQLDAASAALLDDELAFQRHFAASPGAQALPRGPIHADLFRDNVLFDTDAAGVDRVSGCCDFYFAGTDAFAFDVAVGVNDWCCDGASGRLEPARAQALVDGYAGERPLATAELRALPALQRAAALRFWVSRLWDRLRPRAAALLEPKDPAPLARLLRRCRDEPWHPRPVAAG